MNHVTTASSSAELHKRNATYEHLSGLAKIAGIWPGGDSLAVFDAGCGDARLSQGLVADGHTVSGIDASEKAVTAARQRGVAASVGDVEGSWPVADTTQDVVLLLDVLEHTVNHEQVLAEAKRVLKPVGQVLISYPNHFDLRNRLAILFGRGIVHWDTRTREPKAWQYGHVRFLRYEELLKLLRECGFTPEASQLSFMGGGVIPRRALPPLLRQWLTARWPNLFSSKFVVRAAAGTSDAAQPIRKVVLARTPTN